MNAIFTGTNGHIDFNNIGFTGELSPPAEPGVVPLPASVLLLPVAFCGLAALRRRRP